MNGRRSGPKSGTQCGDPSASGHDRRMHQPPPSGHPESRQERWEEKAQLPLLLASLLFVVAYALPILVPDLSPAIRHACAIVVWGTWVVLVAELAVRVSLAERK